MKLGLGLKQGLRLENQAYHFTYGFMLRPPPKALLGLALAPFMLYFPSPQLSLGNFNPDPCHRDAGPAASTTSAGVGGQPGE